MQQIPKHPSLTICVPRASSHSRQSQNSPIYTTQSSPPRQQPAYRVGRRHMRPFLRFPGDAIQRCHLGRRPRLCGKRVWAVGGVYGPGWSLLSRRLLSRQERARSQQPGCRNASAAAQRVRGSEGEVDATALAAALMDGTVQVTGRGCSPAREVSPPVGGRLASWDSDSSKAGQL